MRVRLRVIKSTLYVLIVSTVAVLLWNSFLVPGGTDTTTTQFESEELIRTLRDEVALLKNQLKTLKIAVDEEKPCPELPKIPDESMCKHCAISRHYDFPEIHGGVQLSNEYVLIPFTRFTLTKRYILDPGLGKRVVEKPIGYHAKELHAVIKEALLIMNRNESENHQLTPQHLVEGIYRTLPAIGTQYRLTFLSRHSHHVYTQLSMFRPFSSIETISSSGVVERPNKQLINILLPLSGRLDKFRQFINMFVKVGIEKDQHVMLTVVYFGQDGLAEVMAIVKDVQTRLKVNRIRLVRAPSSEQFSRGYGLKLAYQRWNSTKNVVNFFCDVDIVFDDAFLDRCRLYTRPGKSVYFPVVFSLYNPQLVYASQARAVPPQDQQLVVSKNTGFWRDFGYGMACAYQTDLRNIKAFSHHFVGWGLEDVTLYRKFIHSKIEVVRAPDHGLFHVWHPKNCDKKSLSAEQYKACIQSKAMNEGSHAQLGLLAFHESFRKS